MPRNHSDEGVGRVQVELIRQSLVTQGKRLAEIEAQMADLFEEVSELQRFALSSLSSIRRIEEHVDRFVLGGAGSGSSDEDG